jgi:N-acyl-D-amino-acid deacylase
MISRRRFLSLAAVAGASPLVRAADAPAYAAPISAVVEDFIKKLRFPGAQLAVGREGSILLSKGFGLADRERKLPVQPRTLFRIASMSKCLTSVATLTLVEGGKLTLDTPMLDVLKVQPFLPKGRVMDPRMKDVTVRHLLQHTGGWNRNNGGDVMFDNLRIAKSLGVASPPSAREVIREVISRPLDVAPGTQYSYSNFGYCVLGRIIEDLSSASYGDYVKEHVLKPAGLAGPRLGATLTAAEGEARYYAVNKDGSTTKAAAVFPHLPKSVPVPYGSWSLEQLDSVGGWIAPAEDMVRFLMCLDDIGGTSPFTRRETFDAMLAPPPGEVGHDKDGKPLEKSYACGFRTFRTEQGITFMHTGSLGGTSTVFRRRADGWSWAVFCNQRPPGNELRVTLVESVDKVFDALKPSPLGAS